MVVVVEQSVVGGDRARGGDKSPAAAVCRGEELVAVAAGREQAGKGQICGDIG